MFVGIELRGATPPPPLPPGPGQVVCGGIGDRGGGLTDPLISNAPLTTHIKQKGSP